MYFMVLILVMKSYLVKKKNGQEEMPGAREIYREKLQKEEGQRSQSSFQFRLLLAVILFAILILFDKSDSKTAETAIENFSKVVSADIEDKLKIWVENKVH